MKENCKHNPKIRSLVDKSSFRYQFERAYNTHFDRLFIYSKTITKSEEIAKDVVSDVFLNLWKMHSDFSEIKELDSYLFISVKNLSIRAISRDPQSFVSLDFENSLKKIDKLNPEELLIEKELRITIERAIESLPEQCRLAYRMVKEKNMKYSEAAAELGIKKGTVKNHLIKAVGRIREKVTAHLETANPLTCQYTKLGSIALLFSCLLELSLFIL